MRGPILTLALGLVLFTVIGAGYFVHGVMPARSRPPLAPVLNQILGTYTGIYGFGMHLGGVPHSY